MYGGKKRRVDLLLQFDGLVVVFGPAEAAGADTPDVALQQVGISQMVFSGVVRHSHIYKDELESQNVTRWVYF